MVARQLPKLKTRVRFPSPAPKKIKPTLCWRLFFGFVGDGIEPDTEGSERSAFARSERDPPKSPRVYHTIGLISAGNYTFPSPAPK